MGINFSGSTVVGAAQIPLQRHFPLLGRAGLSSLQPEVSYPLGSSNSGIQVASHAIFGTDAEILFPPFQKMQLLAILN